MLFNVRHSERADRIADGTSGKLDPPISSNGTLALTPRHSPGQADGLKDSLNRF